MKKILAFTLAETLVVIGIIGVVSALTLPNLNSSTANKENVAKVKKVYRDLDQAFGMAKVKYGPLHTWFNFPSSNYVPNREIAGRRIAEFLKVTKDCGVTTNSGCFVNDNLLAYNGYKLNNYDSLPFYKIILSDGTAVAFIPSLSNSELLSFAIYIDIDGPKKGKHKIGHDIFNFEIENGQLNPVRMSSFWGCVRTNAPSIQYYGNCTSGWVIDYDNMDYLLLNSSGYCPNGTAPSAQNPRCK